MISKQCLAFAVAMPGDLGTFSAILLLIFGPHASFSVFLICVPSTKASCWLFELFF